MLDSDKGTGRTAGGMRRVRPNDHENEAEEINDHVANGETTAKEIVWSDGKLRTGAGRSDVGIIVLTSPRITRMASRYELITGLPGSRERKRVLVWCTLSYVSLHAGCCDL